MRTEGAHNEMLDLGGLPVGNYTLVLGNGKGDVSVRVVKQ